MKKLLFLILLFSVIKVFAVSPPVIQNPTPLQVCDNNNDGTAVFDLTTKIGEVLGALNPSLYSVSFHETQTDAAVGGTTIPNPASFVNINAFTQTVYVRVQENLSGEYSIASLDLIVNPTPIIGQPQNISIEQIPFTGTAVFDLTSNDGPLLNGLTGATIAYFTTLIDAQNNTNQIAIAVGLDPAAFIGTNGQIIWARVELATTQCASFASFHLYITNPDIVFIPDANFKARLIGNFVDTNADGEIEYSEALAITAMYVGSSNIADLTGISSFTNLVTLGCNNNHLTSLNVSALTNLVTLDCSANNLNSLNITGLTNLITLDCYENNLTSLDVTALINLHSLDCSVNQISILNVTGLTNLTSINFSHNTLLDADFSSLHNLVGITPGNVTNTLNLSNTNLAGIAFGGAPYSIGTLNLSNCTNLATLSLSGNTIHHIILNGCTALANIYVDNCSLNELDVSTLTNLQNLNSMQNLFETIDVSNNYNLTTLETQSNALKYIYAKNGRAPVVPYSIGGSPNLLFACVDDIQVNQLLISIYPGAHLQISSYCSFVPGGNYNTISGTVTFDGNNNGCDASDDIQSNVRININDGTNTGANFTNNSGNYTFYTQAGSFDITPSIENPAWFTFSPTTATIPLANNNNNTTTQNFCISANGVHPDLEVVIAPIARARPGFDAVYKIVYKNKGNQTLSGNVAFSYDDTVLDFVSSTVIPSSQSTGLLTYNYTNLLPFENRSFYITLHVNTPTDSPSVNIGDQLSFNATASPIAGDEIPSDNTFQYHQTVVGSFDPNDITCIEGNVVPPTEIGNYLHYAINFENTGTADAENIVVKDIIDTTQFDVNSLQILNSSDPVTAKLTGNIAEFIFQNINLHSGGHGNILIKVKSKNTLAQGDTVSKKANIYFDYNAPIDTNLENTTFQSLNNPNFETDASISVYPNPSKGNININCNNTIKSVQLYDVQGRLLQTNMVNENKTVIDISGKSNGIYFIKVLSDKGIVVQKIMKE